MSNLARNLEQQQRVEDLGRQVHDLVVASQATLGAIDSKVVKIVGPRNLRGCRCLHTSSEKFRLS